MNFEEAKKKNLKSGALISIRYRDEIFVVRTFVGGPFKGNLSIGDYIIVSNGDLEEQIDLSHIETIS